MTLPIDLVVRAMRCLRSAALACFARSRQVVSAAIAGEGLAILILFFLVPALFAGA
jgi:hypothetical protein